MLRTGLGRQRLNMQQHHVRSQDAGLISPNRLINLRNGGMTIQDTRRDHLSAKVIRDSGLNNRKD